MKLTFIILLQLLICIVNPGFSQEGWSFLNTSRIGALSFLDANPDADGKNVVIFILDSGVDIGTPGLSFLPDSSVKIIDVHDYSGEGDVYLDVAETGIENDEQFLQTPDGLKLFGYNNLTEQAIDSSYYIGSFEESKFMNNKIKDINANGKLNDRFGVIVFQNKKDNWVAYVDLDADGNLTDEKAVTDYSEYQKPLKFRGYDKEYDYLPLNFALKLYPDQQKVNFHFDASGHGTHVAGIAAGFRINGQETLNGLAPGAKLISLKIGNSRYSGASTTTGAMRDALDYIADYAANHDDAIVVNMSYGIGSEIEGQADIEYYINDILMENINIVVCLSGGNKGPGLSTIGLPAASSRAITVGALNDAENARDVYGGNIKNDKIYNFSSRGGEVAKPDIIAPGAASSTVPPFSSSENKKGTSMAAPQVTGAVALLFSAAKRDFPQKKVPGYKIKKALINSASLLKNYSYPDQGNGVVNVPKSYEYLKKYINEEDILIDYDINTISPFYESGYGSAIFWRYGTYYPTREKKQTVFINPLFDANITADQKNKFYKAFSLSSTADWLKTNQSNIYLKGNGPAEVEVYVDEEKLNKPGLYSAQLIAYKKASLFSSNSKDNIEFRIWCTILVPRIANKFEDNLKLIENISLGPGDIKREYVLVSPTHTALSIRSKQIKSNYANIRIYAYNPAGKIVTPAGILYTGNSNQQTVSIPSPDLIPGIWEIVFYAPFTNPENSVFNYEIVTSELKVYEKIIRNFSITNGSNPTASFTAINNAKDGQVMKIGGGIKGIQKKTEISNAYSAYEQSFRVGDLYKSVEFEIELNKEIYNKLTDFTINIKNLSGKILKTTALAYKSKKVTFSPTASGNYVLELVPAFALEEVSWNATLMESYIYFDQNYIYNQNEMFYPGVEKHVYFSLSSQINVAPDGFHLFGELWIDSTQQNFIRVTIPIEIMANLK